MDTIVDLYEKIEKHDITLTCKKSPIRYKATSSLHSFITDWAYGRFIEKECYDISDGTVLKGSFEVKKTRARFKLKLTACLYDWEKLVNDIKVVLNGTTVIAQNDVFIENVNLGWTGLYFDVPSECLSTGCNRLEISTENSSRGGLYVASASVLELPAIDALQQISMREYARSGELFSVAVYDPDRLYERVEKTENCVYKGMTRFDDVAVLTFIACDEGKTYAESVFAGKTIKLVMPETVENCDNFMIGTDSDDHRHDLSEETDRVIDTFIYSDMGNFSQFRPNFTRNYYRIAPREYFLKQVDKMRLFGIKYGLCNNGGELLYLPEQRPENFFGFHLHEPYHFFNFANREAEYIKKNGELYKFDEMLRSASFGETKAMFEEFLEKIRKKNTAQIGLTSVGSPSLLCVYEGDAGFDRITIEPVSNINLLTGAVRATSVKVWGAHIPTDWYFGIPVDEEKSNKFNLAMQYLYFNGADYIYAENSLFKTNAFERLDFEDEHLVSNRKHLRDFYRYAMKHPRKGKLVVDKAIVYGRNEFIMWQTDDRMGELKAHDWDEKVWGKWNNNHHACWLAAKAWIPHSDRQSSVKTPLNTKLFAGSPYGQTDVVYAEKDFSQYKTLAFLGWNTMDEKLFSRLENFVANGGKLIISYCHFNTVDCNDLPPEYIADERVGEFAGISIDGEYYPQTRADFSDGFSYSVEEGKSVLCKKCNSVSARILCTDACGRGLVFENAYGKGKIYFCAFTEYFSEPWATEVVAHILDLAGQTGEFICDNNNVSFTARDCGEKYIINVLNMNCVPNAAEHFRIKMRGKVIEDDIKVGEIKEYCVLKDNGIKVQ